MGCFVVLFAAAMPRFALFMMWVFGYDKMALAMDSFILGLLGFLLLPYTTVFYILAYAPQGGVSGFGWFIVVFGFLLDISAHARSGKEGKTVYVERGYGV